MNTETVLTICGVWLLGVAVLVLYLTGKVWWDRHQTRQAWKRTPIMGQGPVRVTVRRIL